MIGSWVDVSINEGNLTVIESEGLEEEAIFVTEEDELLIV